MLRNGDSADTETDLVPAVGGRSEISDGEGLGAASPVFKRHYDMPSRDLEKWRLPSTLRDPQETRGNS